MLTFEEFPYRRIDYHTLSGRYEAYLDSLRNARDTASAYFALIEMDYIQRVFVSYATLSEAGATNDSNDAFWQEEERFFGSIKPEFELLIQRRNATICESPYKAELGKLLGKEMIDRAEMQRKTVNETVLPIMRRENELSQRYSELVSQLSAKDGDETLTMPQLSQRGASPDHAKRKKYALLAEQTYLTIADELDALYDEMVRVRTQIARATGFENLTDYCIAKHARTGYGREDLTRFARSVEEELVPFVSELSRAQEMRLGHPVMDYDEGTLLPGKAVCVVSDPIPAFSRIFRRLSPETKVFFDELTERRFYDLALRSGKTMGAYSNYLPLCQMPYIFQTYNATEGAARTFAHECGHGLHSFLHRGEPVMDASACSQDVSETHSMSMEFLIWSCLDELVAKKDIPIYQYRHLKDSFAFICYGTAIDRFQTQVYDHPDMLPKDRLTLWRELELRFLPWRKHEAGLFFDQGRAWQRQIHVMKWPFYYIDYVLAQVCALQFFAMDTIDHDAAWDTYIRFLKDSGKQSFPETVRRAGLPSPFEKGSIRKITRSVAAYMASLEI